MKSHHVSRIIFFILFSLLLYPLYATNVSGTISESTTWTVAGSPWVVTAAVFVQGTALPILTIEPGATVQFNSGTYLQVGSSNPGGLIAVGTPGSPITITGSTPTPGQYRILIESQSISTATRFEHCIIEYGGFSNYTFWTETGATLILNRCLLRNGTGDAIFVSGTPTLFSLSSSTIQNFSDKGIEGNSSNPSIVNCVFKDINGYGIYVNNPTINNVTFDNTGNYPVSMSAQNVNQLSSATFTNITANPGIEVRGGDVITSGTWINHDMPYIITTNVQVQSASVPILTLEPGVIMKFNSGVYFQVGSANPAGLIAVGTPGNPITFTGVTPTPGQWRILIESESVSTASRFEHCIFEYGGSGNYTIYSETDATLILNRCILRNGIGDAIYVGGDPFLFSLSSCTIMNFTDNGIDGSVSNPTITDCYFQNIDGYGVLMNLGNLTNSVFDNTGENPISLSAGKVANLTGLTFLNITANPGIEIRGGTVDVTGTWINYNMPYIIYNSILVEGVGVPILTLQTGQIIKFNTSAYIRFGSSHPGGIIAVGTPGNPITFTGNTPTPGQWRMLIESQSISTATRFEHCIFEYGGAGNYTFYTETGATLNITHCLFRDGTGDAFNVSGTPTQFSLSSCTIMNFTDRGIDGSSSNPNVTDCVFINITNNAIYASGNQITNCIFDTIGNYPISLLANYIGYLSNNTYISVRPGIEARGDVIEDSAIWPNIGLPYVINGSVYVYRSSGSSQLTLEPGVVVKFNPSSGFFIGSSSSGTLGGLIAMGSIESPIYFTSVKDDTIGGDSNGDGSGSLPIPGDWQAIYIDDFIVPATILDHCIIRYGGQSYNAAIYCASEPVIQYCLIENSSQSGIYSYYGNLNLKHNTVKNNQTYGLRVGGGSVPADIQYNSFVNNAVGIRSEVNLITNFKNNNLSQNTSFGAQNSQFTNVLGEQNWWGDATGPYDNSTNGLYNPSGLGVGVSDNIDYDPWLKSNPLQPGNIPDIKLLVGTNQTGVFDLDNYLGDTAASWDWSNDPATDQARITIQSNNSVDFDNSRETTFLGIDTVAFQANWYLADTSVVKYSSFYFTKLPPAIFKNGQPVENNSIELNDYIVKDSGTPFPSYNFIDYQYTDPGDNGKLNATYNGTQLDITASSALNAPAKIILTFFRDNLNTDDWDKQIVNVYELLHNNTLFTTASETTQWGYENAPAASVRPVINWLSSYNGASGVLNINYNSISQGIKMTLGSSHWKISSTNQWYTIRMKVMSDTPGNTMAPNLFIYNGQPPAAFDVAAHAILSTPTTWTWMESSLYAEVTGSVYPQLVMRNSNSIGNVYIDAIEVAPAKPEIVSAYGNTLIRDTTGDWNESTDSNGWGFEAAPNSASASYTVSGGRINITFTGSGQQGYKITGIVGAGVTNTYPVNPGQNAGMKVNIESSGSLSNPLLLLAIFGTDTIGGTVIRELGASAAVFRLPPSKQWITTFLPIKPYMYGQFQVKNSAAGQFILDDTFLIIDSDLPNYWDYSLVQ